jgi:hypothetical protein
MTVNQLIEQVKLKKRNGTMTGRELICSLYVSPSGELGEIFPSIDCFVDDRMNTLVFSPIELTPKIQKNL